MVASAKSGGPSRRRSNIGAQRRSSTTAKTAPGATPPVSSPTSSGRSQLVRASTRPGSTPASAAPGSSIPGRSTGLRRCAFARDSVSTSHDSSANDVGSAAISQYVLRQPSAPAAALASNGPTAMPAPQDAPRTPVARVRCGSRGKPSVVVSGASTARTGVAASAAAPAPNIRCRP